MLLIQRENGEDKLALEVHIYSRHVRADNRSNGFYSKNEEQIASLIILLRLAGKMKCGVK